MAKLLPLSCAQEEKKEEEGEEGLLLLVRVGGGRRRRLPPPPPPNLRTDPPLTQSQNKTLHAEGKGAKVREGGEEAAAQEALFVLVLPLPAFLEISSAFSAAEAAPSTSNTHTQAHRGKRDYPPFLFLLLQKAAVVAAAAAGDAARGGGGGGGETGHRKRRKGREGELEREGGTDGRTHRLSLQSPHP